MQDERIKLRSARNVVGSNEKRQITDNHRVQWIDKEMFYRSIYLKAKPKKAMSILLYLFTATLYREWEGKNKKV